MLRPCFCFCVPITILLWLIPFTELVAKEKQKLILITYTIIGIVFEIFFLYFIFTDSTLIGELTGSVDVTYTSFVRYYLLFILGTLLITGVLFARASLRSDNPEHKVKGRLLLIAWVLFIVGGIFDSSIELTPVTLPLVRIILIISSICFYGGFILPDWMKNLFVKKK